MKIQNKLVLGISTTLIISFAVFAFSLSTQIMSNNKKMIDFFLTMVENSNAGSIDRLSSGFKKNADTLTKTDIFIQKMFTERYMASYDALIKASINRIFPMIADYDFDSVNKIIQELVDSNPEIIWVQYIVSENPAAGDIYEFGEKNGGENTIIISDHRQDDFAFVKVEIQFSQNNMMNLIGQIKSAFLSINKGNQTLIQSLTKAEHASLEEFKKMTKKYSARYQKKLTIQMLFQMFATLVFVIIILFFLTRSITKVLQRIASRMNEGANQVSSASDQVSSSSRSIAEEASHQAASIEETSSSMEEMSSMTKKNSENAGQADSLMKEASQVVVSANMSMEQLTCSMKDISKASRETSKIIKTIDEIAFQTNLLALNAAVEAARAGEVGAGFAVVADEVRSLAMRAADAAKDIAELIEVTVKKVSDGSNLVTRTNHAFKQVAESTAKVGDLVASISEGSKEQSIGIDQVNFAIAKMDKMVQQNAVSAEESASFSEEMNAQAEKLRDYVRELVLLVTGKRDQSISEDGTPTMKPSSGNKKNITSNTKETRLDQVIPFEDDDDIVKNF